jgi:hypothetical protein
LIIIPPISGQSLGGLIADKAFDANWIITELNSRGAKIVLFTHFSQPIFAGVSGPAQA